MGIVIRQSIKGSVFSYLGVLIGYFNALWLMPKVLLPEEIGLIRVIQDMALLFIPFAQIGLQHSTIRFFPKFRKDEQPKRELLSFLLAGSALGYLLFLALAFLLKDPILSLFEDKSPRVAGYFNLVLLLTLMITINSILEAYCRSLLKTVIIMFTKEVLIRFLLSAIVLLYFVNILSFNQLLIGVVVIYGMVLLVLISYLSYLKEFRLTTKFTFLDKKLIRQIVRYSLFALLGSGGTLIIMKIDSVMVTFLLGTSINGIYITAFYIAMVVDIPQRAVRQITFPLVARAFEENNMKEVKMLYRKTSIHLLIIGLLIFIGIFTNLDNIYRLVPNGTIYEAGRNVVILIALGKLIDMAMSLNGEIILISKHYKFNNLFIGILALLTILLNILLIPHWGIEGAAFASALSLVSFNLAKFIFIWVKLKLQPFTRQTFKLLIISFLVGVLAYIVPSLDNVFADLALRSAIAIFAYFLCVIGLKISPEANQLFHLLLARFLSIRNPKKNEKKY